MAREHPSTADIESDFEPEETAAEFARRDCAATGRAGAKLPLLARAAARLGRRHPDAVSDQPRLR